MSVEANIEVVRRLNEALTNRDWAAFPDLVAVDCEWTEVPSGETIHDAVSLARTYAGDAARRLVNGVLGSVSRPSGSEASGRGAKDG